MKKPENEINPEVIPLTPPSSTLRPIRFLNRGEKIEYGFFHCWAWIQLDWKPYITNEQGDTISQIYFPEVKAITEDSDGSICLISPFDFQFIRENKAGNNQPNGTN